MYGLLSLAACTGGSATKPDAGPSDTGTTPSFTLPTDLVITDREDYAYEATWTIPSTPVASGSPVIQLDWGTHTVDATGATRAADSYPWLALYEAATTAGDLADRLAADDVYEVLVDSWALDVSGETSAGISDLGIDPRTMTEDEGRSWLLVLADREGERVDVRDALVLVPDEAQQGFVVTFPDGLASYEAVVRMNGTDTLRTDADRGEYSLDWSALTVDAYGKPFVAERVDEVFVGRFDDADEADDLGPAITDLAAAASGFWTADPGGATQISLSECRDAGGAAFPGFTSGTSWLVGGRCTTCFGPAPLFAVVVDIRQP